METTLEQGLLIELIQEIHAQTEEIKKNREELEKIRKTIELGNKARKINSIFQ